MHSVHFLLTQRLGDYRKCWCDDNCLPLWPLQSQIFSQSHCLVVIYKLWQFVTSTCRFIHPRNSLGHFWAFLVLWCYHLTVESGSEALTINCRLFKELFHLTKLDFSSICLQHKLVIFDYMQSQIFNGFFILSNLLLS